MFASIMLKVILKRIISQLIVCTVLSKYPDSVSVSFCSRHNIYPDIFDGSDFFLVNAILNNGELQTQLREIASAFYIV